MISKRGMIEGLLFASPQPVAKKTLIELFELASDEVDALVEQIKSTLEHEDHGFQLIDVAGGYQLRTKNELKEIMARFYEKKPPRLTQAALEVLSIISYKQPITRPEIEKIRGVDCTSLLKTLLERELIEMRGRAELPGNPVIYGTTPKFLEWFQINKLEDLPPLSEIEVLNRGREEGLDHLLDSLTKDDGFANESLSEMDDTLKSLTPSKIEDVVAASMATDSSQPSTGSNAATENLPEILPPIISEPPPTIGV